MAESKIVVETPHTPCPYCGVLLRAVERRGSVAPPSPGDATLCGACAGLLLITPDMRVEKYPALRFGLLSYRQRADLAAQQRAIRLRREAQLEAGKLPHFKRDHS